MEVSGKYKELLSSASPPASRKYPINVQEINKTISLTDEHAFSFITMPSVQLMQRAPFGHILISFQNISESPHNRRHGPIYFRTSILQMLRRSNMKWNEYTLKPILEEEFHGNSCALIPWSMTIGHVIVRATLADFPSVILSYL